MRSKRLHHLAANIQASQTVRTTELEKIDVQQPVSWCDVWLALAVLAYLLHSVIRLYIHNHRANFLTVPQ